MEDTFDPKELLFIGTCGHVKAIDKRTGEDRWQTSLPGTGFEIVSVICEGFLIYAGSKGYVFGLDARTGAILWTNGLSGLGHEDMSLAIQIASREPPPILGKKEKEDLGLDDDDQEQSDREDADT